MKRDLLTGFGAVAVLAVAYLIATPTGRAVRLAVRGVPPGTPQADVEAWVGECDDATRTFCQININFTRCDPENRQWMLEDVRVRTEAGTTASNRYWGPLFAVEFNFAGHETSRLVEAKVVPQFRPMGALNALGVLLIGVGVAAMSRRSRRAAGEGVPLPT